MLINKNEVLHEWLKTSPFLNRLLFDHLSEESNACSVSFVDSIIVNTFIDGSATKTYTFALMAMLPISDTTDANNTDNMGLLNEWQYWINEQELNGNYPDFGTKCSCYTLSNLQEEPSLSMQFESGMAKYMLLAKIEFTEER